MGEILVALLSQQNKQQWSASDAIYLRLQNDRNSTFRIYYVLVT